MVSRHQDSSFVHTHIPFITQITALETMAIYGQFEIPHKTIFVVACYVNVRINDIGTGCVHFSERCTEGWTFLAPLYIAACH